MRRINQDDVAENFLATFTRCSGKASPRREPFNRNPKDRREQARPWEQLVALLRGGQELSAVWS